jgi:16S rRNA (cytosine1402-N4)-methyltransferase
MYHIPVLLNESVDGLNIKEEGVYVDATYGGGGHATEILKRFNNGSLIAFDQDEEAIANRLEDERLVLINQNFRYMKNFLRLYKAVPVNGILADLGISSHQIDEPERGFSVRYDADLDLRMDKRKDLTGQKLVNEYSVKELRDIFFTYGDLKNAFKIAKFIEAARLEQEINTTNELKDALSKLAPRGQENRFFARVFQAIRIEVNDELGALKEFLKQSEEILEVGGRLVVISYHSLEDRLVKNFVKSGNFEGRLEKDFYGNPLVNFKLINRKPIVPSDQEIESNSRARSAKLRIVEKI